MLTDAQLAQFNRDGCIVVPGFISPQKLRDLRDESERLLSAFDVRGHPMAQFHAGNDNHIGGAYFLDSSDKVHYFLEPDSVDPATHSLTVPPHKAINKIGHSLHTESPPFAAFTLKTPELVTIARQLGFVDPRVLQSMLIFKQPNVGGAVPPHQDSSFLYTEPNSAIGFWFALEDCDETNGALTFVPGSHKTSPNPVTRRFVRKAVASSESDKAETGIMFIGPLLPPFSDDKYVMPACPAGSLVLIHGAVVHASGENRSSRSRWAYTFHVIEGTAEYKEDNWLQMPPGKAFTQLYIV